MPEREAILWQCFWAAAIGGLLFNFPGALVGLTVVGLVHVAGSDFP